MTWLRIVSVLLLLGWLAGCGGEPGEDDADGATVTVFAAASLTAVFEQIAEDFEVDHEGVTVALSLGGSSDLVAQIQEGAPADVFASADEANMSRLAADGLVGDEQPVFATNTLQIAVPPDNPARVTSLRDLAAPGLALVVCAPAVPCGAAAQALAAAAGVDLRPVSEEQSVTDVLGKVVSGEADAGLVYRTDVLGAGDAVLGIEVDGAATVVNRYPIAVLAGSDDRALAREFVDRVLGAAGQRVLADAGFGRP